VAAKRPGGALERLHEIGIVDNPVNKYKSVVFT